ncbi:zinc finger C2H2-type/integrase DNA-binding domain-containing protein [Artemisia annua]|uniref:Zinc finger C2H2-type/integrase DNA-binding domain-containing protein n=1 Tax=Artemisia annua TaxID=35608 RepID=A0A2U1K8T2_ARTAN|nr:zinc finger C2H2-type/integrase DNA-binding domain-containing protein [Artemisia annua]
MTTEMNKQSDKCTMMIVEHLEENSGFPDSDYGYECKTCKKRFKSYQALGGHQGVHKKIKRGADYDAALCLLSLTGVPTVSSGLHRCKMCTKEFETGQALGGHMRQHRLEKQYLQGRVAPSQPSVPLITHNENDAV